jgi:uncharacterized glyoxalase superfamily protein PhnB
MPIWCMNARYAGAAIIIELADVEYGGRRFSCRDPRWTYHIWSLGTTNPAGVASIDSNQSFVA